ncbi:hypothetical protein SDC9_172610 [bioreactor metagenome]|uniref:Uncharacterized protein n=1 Tax=bioreactor metagenome TaxID=1076179 RepID=A0A645GNC8_9ZZZZ
MRSSSSWLSQNLSTLNIVFFNTTEQNTDVIASLTLVELFSKHFDTSHHGRFLLADTDNINWITNFDDTGFDTTRYHGSPTFDREHVFDWHQERLVQITHWLVNVFINGIHEFHDLILSGFVTFQGFQSTHSDHRRVVAIETIFGQELTDFHFD